MNDWTMRAALAFVICLGALALPAKGPPMAAGTIEVPAAPAIR